MNDMVLQQQSELSSACYSAEREHMNTHAGDPSEKSRDVVDECNLGVSAGSHAI